MPKHPQYDATDKLAILLHGGILGIHGKTGLAILRFAPERVAVVIDSQTSDGNLADLTGIPLQRDIPIVATAEEALGFQPQTLVLGRQRSAGSYLRSGFPT